jgi:hypothetical protein
MASSVSNRVRGTMLWFNEDKDLLLERATTFRQGEALSAGLIAPHPALLRFGSRLAQEGGGDVPADWARPE